MKEETAMTTKEQERRALEQIRKIVEGLGDNSYVGTAFEGCFEDAEQNIENDWAMSWENRAVTATKRYEKAETELVRVSKEKAGIQKLYEEAEQAIKTETNRANQLANRITQLNEEMAEAVRMYSEKETREYELNQQLSEKDAEIMKLKAKLYDLMVK